MIKVKNLGGTASKTCNCKSWLNHWKNNSGGRVLPTSCVAYGTHSGALVGGHVKKVGVTDNDHYIIPICTGHNNLSTDNDYYVLEGYFVSANKSKTCEQ